MTTASKWLELARKALNEPVQIAQLGQIAPEAPTKTATVAEIGAPTPAQFVQIAQIGAGAQGELDERAAIVAEGSGTSQLWAEAYAAVCWMRQVPPGVADDEWARIKAGMGRFLDRWSARAERAGWRPAELFSVDSSSTLYRAFGRGDVVSISSDQIVFDEGDGVQRYARGTSPAGGRRAL